MLTEYIQLLLARLLTKKQKDTPIERGSVHRQQRWFIYLPRNTRTRRIALQLATAVLSVVFVISAGNLLGYGAEYLSSIIASYSLRHTYQEERRQEDQRTPIPAESTATPVPTPESSQLPPDEETPLPTATPVERLKAVPYPNNPYTIMSSRFSKIRRQNKDIIGWLTIDGLVDEAVVQRDNQYYLNRDYKGYHNNNGAIFLDEVTSLRTRPYTLMLYGHNMKSGRMFGGLRNFEDLTFYRKNPFITFDTIYEDGRYVIFAACTISTNVKNWRYVNWSHMNSTSVALRKEAIDSLFRFSVYGRYIDVQPDDQILLLVTCVAEEEDRRVIAARRLRDGETEEELLKSVQKTRKK